MRIIEKFKNDYNQTCHPAILEALTKTNSSEYTGYGLDSISKKTADYLRELADCPHAAVFFLAGGTLTNLLVISAFLRPHQAVIAAESGHIAIHETGAIEATGHKVLTCPCKDGKLRPENIRNIVNMHDNEHMVQPKLVYISQATELGSVYTLAELTALSQTCKELNLYLFMDGARLGVALVKNEGHQETPTLAHLAKLCDAFYVGGTKNGALFGEALVLTFNRIQKDFRYLCKQRGAMLAKGWLVATQFEALFKDNLYYELARNANEVAKYIDTKLTSMKIPLLIPTATNQIFPILPVDVVEKLAQSHAFEIWAKNQKTYTIRFVTSWGTGIKEARALIRALNSALSDA